LFFSHTHDRSADATHSNVKPSYIAATLYPQIVGQGFGILGALGGLYIDQRENMKRRGSGHDASTTNIRVLQLERELDGLLLEFEETSRREGEDAQSSELLLLRDFRNIALSEYVTAQSRNARVRGFRRVGDLLALSRNTVGLIGNSLNVAAVLRENKPLNGTGSILNAAAASQITLRPALSAASAAIARKAASRRLRNLFGEVESVDVATFEQHRMAYEASGTRNMACEIYQDQLELLKQHARITYKENVRGRTLTVRGFRRESLFGPTKVCQSVIGIIQGFRGPHSLGLDNRMAAAGNTVYCSGQAYNLSELSRQRSLDEADHRHERMRNLLTIQQVQHRIIKLEQMRARLE
ncbi:MAG: hypothetical protein C5B53_12615, partial [Candidatus Melainabacteria bacterium]